jgi:hypothetical protein
VSYHVERIPERDLPRDVSGGGAGQVEIQSLKRIDAGRKARCVCRERVRYVKRIPFQIPRNWIRMERAEDTDTDSSPREGLPQRRMLLVDDGHVLSQLLDTVDGLVHAPMDSGPRDPRAQRRVRRVGPILR